MASQHAVEQMSNDQILATFHTSEEPDQRGFDEAMEARVFAYQLVRSRGRFAHYRALYGAFISAGRPFMIENLDETSKNGEVPAKLVFSDEAPGPEVVDDPMLMVWTERELLEALEEERAIQDFYVHLLEELSPELTRA